MSDQFVVHRLRSKPVEYTVRIRHFVAGGEWQIGVTVMDVADEGPEECIRVASDLRTAADLLEPVSLESKWMELLDDKAAMGRMASCLLAETSVSSGAVYIAGPWDADSLAERLVRAANQPAPTAGQE